MNAKINKKKTITKFWTQIPRSSSLTFSFMQATIIKLQIVCQFFMPKNDPFLLNKSLEGALKNLLPHIEETLFSSTLQNKNYIQRKSLFMIRVLLHQWQVVHREITNARMHKLLKHAKGA